MMNFFFVGVDIICHNDDEHFDIFDNAKSSWAAYGEFTLPAMYGEWNKMGQQLIAGQIDGKEAAKYLEEQRLKIHFNE